MTISIDRGLGRDGVDAPVLTSYADGVLTITLNRPHRRNALPRSGFDALGATLRTAERDPDVRVIVLRGVDGHFCSGADLESAGGPGHPLDGMRLVNSTARTLAEMPKPVIACVEGYAVGAGCNLALLCDLVIATPTAKFSQIFAKRGVSVDFGGSWILPRLVGLQQAKRLVMLAETIEAEEARELGLVTWVKEPEEIDSFLGDVARRLADGPPVALALSKSLLDRGSGGMLGEALDREAHAFTINFATDAPNAIRAFVQRRPAVFDGEWQVR
ncbi:enoyl-CoA hydratase/isomerase family protein [Rhodococcus opacus]|uniref:enoyl-CoA hydratase/isomerase family protein n=1 Tax=Rhodococcus opacus TaxID=37919 RepID=UPI001C47FA14|nr:enoyl-CoA hydratase [Rhodococcus opacus]MBV6754864.1 enoyl-CoA hydratase [Rhodococcus opacus]